MIIYSRIITTVQFFVLMLIATGCSLAASIESELGLSGSFSITLDEPSPASGDTSTNFQIKVNYENVDTDKILLTSDLVDLSGSASPCGLVSISDADSSSPTISISQCTGAGQLYVKILPGSLQGDLAEEDLGSDVSVEVDIVAQAPAPGWTWLEGTQLVNQSTVYGALGVPTANTGPGGRAGGVLWHDNDGHLYMFGGYGYDSVGVQGRMADLWKFDISQQLWVYLGGGQTIDATGNWGTRLVPSVSNWPSARSGATYAKDDQGDLWMYGGRGVDGVGTSNRRLDDLWKYDVSAGTWVWLSGTNTHDNAKNNAGAGIGVYDAANVLGAKYSGFAFFKDDTDEFFLFGGSDGSWYTWRSDMWSYDVALDQWAFQGDSPHGTKKPEYGTKQVETASNWPGERHAGAYGKAPDGTFWIFGGEGRDENDSEGPLNDLWKYNPSNGQWTWMAGDKSHSQPGVYGTKGEGSSLNTPGARWCSRAGSVDNNGNFMLYGGFGRDEAGTNTRLGDLWEFDSTINQWIFQWGIRLSASVTPIYGTQGEKSETNVIQPLDDHHLWHNGLKLYIQGGKQDGGDRVDALWSYD